MTTVNLSVHSAAPRPPAPARAWARAGTPRPTRRRGSQAELLLRMSHLWALHRCLTSPHQPQAIAGLWLVLARKGCPGLAATSGIYLRSSYVSRAQPASHASIYTHTCPSTLMDGTDIFKVKTPLQKYPSALLSSPFPSDFPSIRFSWPGQRRPAGHRTRVRAAVLNVRALCLTSTRALMLVCVEVSARHVDCSALKAFAPAYTGVASLVRAAVYRHFLSS